MEINQNNNIPLDVKLKLKVLKSELLQNVENSLDNFATNLEDQQSCNGAPNNQENNNDKAIRNHNEDPQKSSREKNYVMRDSLLTTLFTGPHMKAVYNFFWAMFLHIIMITFVKDVLEDGYPNLQFDLLTWCFGKLPIVITIWMLMFLSVVGLLYPGFHYWSLQTGNRRLVNTCAILAYLVYLSALFVFPVKYLFAYDLPIASSFIVICEQVRFFMKVHSFVMENVPRANKWKDSQTHKDDDEVFLDPNVPCPKLEKFVYFLFAPVLIYRDEYPRTKSINWILVLKCFGEAFGCIFYTYFVIARFCVPNFQNFNVEHITMKTFALTTFNAILPGTICLLLLFYGLLHAWLNAFAEMLRFGDRLFYKDWWNSQSFPAYYRTWNTVIHDWLFIYVYRDVNRLLGDNFKAPGAITVFFISSVVHEYLFITAFKFFYPVIFSLYFSFGVFFFFWTQRTTKRSRTGNIFMWFNLMSGNGMFMGLYSMEWYARINCRPYYEDSFLDFLVPRSLTCP